MNLADPLEQALAFHQSGQLARAETIYREILQSDPLHPGALHLLGMVAHQCGRHDSAVELIARAIAIRPSQPVFHNNLGEAYRALGRLPEARACYEKAVELDVTFSAAHFNLGLVTSASQPAEAERHYAEATRLQPNFAAAHNNLGNVLRAQGRLAEAEAAYRAALRYQADYAQAIGNLGAVLLEVEKPSEAIEQLRRAIELQPDSAEAHFNLGNAYKAQENWQQAVTCYRRALALRGDFDAAGCNLATALTAQGDVAGARDEYRAILRRNADHFETLLNYGSLLLAQGEMEDALATFERAVRIQGASAVAHFKLATALVSNRKREEAAAGFREALRLQPDYADAHIQLARVYNDLEDHDRALDHCRQALALGSTSETAYGNAATALHAQGKGHEAIECYRQSLALHPENAAEHSNMLYALNLVPECEASALFAEHLEWARRHAEPFSVAALPHANDRTPDRRLRVGYVSPHFFEHAVNYFVEPILANHDRDGFEVYCYSSVYAPDVATQRLKSLSLTWRDVARQSDEQLARLVRDDAIDILVDLSGHMGRNRLLAFARKPAPVQVTYLGYQNTTGMSAMGYRLTDERADPPGVTDQYYTEKLVRLPRAFFCYQPLEAPPVWPLPARQSGHVTFGSFNNFAKVTPPVIDAWLTILARVPGSRLLVLAYRGGYLERHLHDLATERGIDSARIELCDKRPRFEYLQLIGRADIALDPFPLNGHTTTCDSIWMGVPVVKIDGETYASRFGGSVLTNVGLDDLCTSSVEAYIDCAVRLAGDLERLSHLRGELRETMAASPLLDFSGFTRHLEQAYREMWTEWCHSAD